MVIEGEFGQHYDRVLIDGGWLNPHASQKVWNHSPDGFSWGYGGSGPAQLALGILLAAGADKETAVRLHQDFKNEFVARWPQASFRVEVDVAGWLAERRAALIQEEA